MQYYFLLNDLGLSATDYVYLNISQSIAIFVGITVFMYFMSKFEIRTLILISFALQLLGDFFNLSNVLRWNINIGVSDFAINVAIICLGRAMMISLCVLPVMIKMMTVCPKNIEASMFAVISSIISMSTDWSADFVGGIILDIFGVDDEHEDNYHYAIIVAICMTLVTISLIPILPTNDEIAELTVKMNRVAQSYEGNRYQTDDNN
jgi:hypothetical protein